MMSFGPACRSQLVLFTIFSSVWVENFALQKISDKYPLSKQPHIVTIIADDLFDVVQPAFKPPTSLQMVLRHSEIAFSTSVVGFGIPILTIDLQTGRVNSKLADQRMQGPPLNAGERWGIPLGTPLLPEYLRNLGYTTRLVGKWHVGYYSVDHTPSHRGFDSFLGYYSGYIKYFNHTITNSTGYDLHRDTPDSSEVDYNSEYFTDVVTQEAEEIIRSHNVSEPLYLQVAHLAPHTGELDKPLEVWNVTEVNKTFGYIKDNNRRMFAGMVARLDYSVGRIVRALKKCKMLENAIIIFTADNGAQTEGFRGNHGSNYPLRGNTNAAYNGGAIWLPWPELEPTSRLTHTSLLTSIEIPENDATYLFSTSSRNDYRVYFHGIERL